MPPRSSTRDEPERRRDPSVVHGSQVEAEQPLGNGNGTRTHICISFTVIVIMCIYIYMYTCSSYYSTYIIILY